MMNYNLDALADRLRALADDQYRAFSMSLIPGARQTALGVRLPPLRAISREILKENWRGFLEATRNAEVYEFLMLHAMVLGGAKCPIEEKIALTDAFLPDVDNWAVCDALCSSFKPRRQDMPPLFEFVCSCAESPVEFRKRFGLIMMMDYYRQDPYAPRVMAAYRRFSHEGYYARMGAAWGLATLFLFQREAVLDILRDGVLDEFTHNRAIQKMCESLRISDDDKELVRTLKRTRR